MAEPICPNDLLEGLQSMVEEAARNWDHKIGDHNMEAIAEVLARVRRAQSEGRVTADPSETRPWNHQILERRAASLAALQRQRWHDAT